MLNIPVQDITHQQAAWQTEFQRIITDPIKLIDRLQLPKTLKTDAINASQLFPLRVPEPYIRRIQPQNPTDPLLLQVLPLGYELTQHDTYTQDPVGEVSLNQPVGMIQKYPGRVLLMLSRHCVINCRYCFRRHFPYSEHHIPKAQWRQRLNEIAGDQSISEVIYSGGDPLSLGDQQLAWFTRKIGQIPHIKRLRVHTRLPIMVPSRVTDTMVDAITHSNLNTVVVVHSNHANEIDAAVTGAFRRLSTAGITLLNQSVLLRRINDSATTLSQLSETLFDAGVMPYYLHTLDKVSGAHHFAVSDADTQHIYQTLQTQLPGYLVPILATEEAGKLSKTRRSF